ncbi:MAG: tetratricopeptide repeat protein [Cyclobacteriaceae bacterium]
MRVFIFIVVVCGLLAGCTDTNSQEGDQFFKSGDYETAVKHYDQYLQVNPDHIKSYYNRGRAYEELELAELARADFEQVLELDPKNVQACSSLGGYYYNKQDYKSASAYYERAISNNKDNPQSYFLKARSDHKMGLKNEAMNGYNTAIKLNPQYGEAFLYRGALRSFLKQNKGACADFAKARDLKVDKADITYSKFCQ